MMKIFGWSGIEPACFDRFKRAELSDLTVFEFCKCIALEWLQRPVLEEAIKSRAIDGQAMVKDCKDQIAALPLSNGDDWTRFLDRI